MESNPSPLSAVSGIEWYEAASTSVAGVFLMPLRFPDVPDAGVFLMPTFS
jgi:hypothetical protein